MSFNSAVEYVEDVPRWVAVEYQKSNALTPLDGLTATPVWFDTGNTWANMCSINGSGRLEVPTLGDFSGGNEDAVWVLAFPMNPSAGSSPVASQESLGLWLKRYRPALEQYAHRVY